MTPDEIKSTRRRLGLSAAGLARLLQLGDARTVRRWEAGDNPVPGPVVVLLGAILSDEAVRRHFGLSLADEPREETD